MWPRRLFPGRMFAPRFFPQSGGVATAETPGEVFRRREGVGRTFRRDAPDRVFRRREGVARVFRREGL